MQPRSEECREHAAECEEIAKRHSGLIKQKYEQIADQWLFLRTGIGIAMVVAIGLI